MALFLLILDGQVQSDFLIDPCCVDFLLLAIPSVSLFFNHAQSFLGLSDVAIDLLDVILNTVSNYVKHVNCPFKFTTDCQLQGIH